ncbi:MAG: flagellar protein FliT [Bacillota bacterium]
MNNLKDLQQLKLEYLQNIYNLTLEQKKALDANDVDELQRLLDEKQAYINKINLLDFDLKKMGNNNNMFQPVLQSIIDVDKENRNAAAEFLFILKDKVGKVRQGRKVHQAYNPYQSQAAFINKAR